MRRLAIAAGVLILLAVGVAVALTIAFPPERVRALVVRRAGTATGFEIDLERASLGLGWRGIAISARGLTLRNPARAGEDPVIRLEGLEAGVALWPLFRREVRVTRLVLEDAKVFLFRDAQGALNAAVRPKAPGGAPAAEAPGRPGQRARLLFAVPAAEVRNASIRFVDEKAKAAYDIADLDGELRVGFEPDTVRVRADFTLDGAAADLRPGGGAAYGPLRLGLRGDLAHHPASGRTVVRDGTLSLEAIELEVNGIVDAGSAAAAAEGAAPAAVATPAAGAAAAGAAAAGVERPAQLDLSLASGPFESAKVLSLLGRRAPSGLGIAGTAQLRALVRGPANAPAVDGALVLSGVEVTPQGRDRPLLTGLSGEARFTRTTLETSELRGQIAGNPFTLSAQLSDFARPAVTGKLGLDARLADLAALLRLPPDLVIESGTVGAAVDFSTQAPNFAQALRLEGTARGNGIGARMPGVRVPVRELTFTADLRGRRAAIEPFQLLLGRSDFRGKLVLVSLDKPSLEIDLASRHLDLDELMGPKGAPPAAGAAAAPPGERKPPTLVPARGRVRVEELTVRGLVARQASLDLTIDERGIRLDNMHGALLGGTLGGRVWVNPAVRDSLRYESALELKGVQANEVLKVLTPVKDLIYGTLQADVDLSGVRISGRPPGSTLNAIGNAAVADGHLAVRGALAAVLRQLGMTDSDRLDFQRISTHLKVERGRVTLDDFQLGGSRYGEFNLAGSVGLDGSLDYSVRALLPKRYLPRELAGRREVMELLADASGRVPLDFAVIGSMRDPRVKLNLRAIEEQIAARAKEKVKARVEEEGKKAREQVEEEGEKAKKRVEKEGEKVLEDATRRLGDLLRGKRKPAAPDTADTAAGGKR